MDAGTYTVELVVTDEDGSTDTKTQQIVVTDPDTVFSGINTTCITNGSNYVGCPAGAGNIFNADFDNAVNTYSGSGKRVLFRRGDTFTADATSDIDFAGIGTIGAFGTGAQPIVNTAMASDLFLLASGSAGYLNDWRFLDIDYRVTGGTGDTELFRSDNQVHNILIMGNTGYRFLRHVGISAGGVEYYASQGADTHINTNVFIVENDFAHPSSHNLYVAAEGLVVAGNSLDRATGSHILRITYANPLLVNHNYIFGETGATTHTIKYHSFAADGSDSHYDHNYASSGQFLFADNYIEAGDTNDWSIAFGAQSGGHNEWVIQGIFERNHVTSGAETVISLYTNTQDHTVRNNLFDMSAGQDYAVTVSLRGLEPTPDNNNWYNNTVHTTANGSGVGSAFAIGTTPTNTRLVNNVFFTADGSGDIYLGKTPDVMSNNNVTAQAGGSSRFLPTVAEIDAGAALSVLLDYKACNRPDSVIWDIGAYEDNATCGSTGGVTVLIFPPNPTEDQLEQPEANDRWYQWRAASGWGRPY